MDQSGSNKGLIIAVGALAAIAIIVCIVLGVMQYNSAQTISNLEASVATLEQKAVNTANVNAAVSNTNATNTTVNTNTAVVNTNASTSANTNTATGTEETTLKTFESDDLGITFTYPKTYTVTTQTVFGDWKRVTVADKTNRQSPEIVLEVNPDGMDFAPNKIYTVTESTDGGVTVTKEETGLGGEIGSTDTTLIVAQTLKASNGNSYFWHYTYTTGMEDLESELKTVLSSVQFTN